MNAGPVHHVEQRHGGVSRAGGSSWKGGGEFESLKLDNGPSAATPMGQKQP